MSSVTTGRPVCSRASARSSRPFSAEALEGVGRGARLEGAAAQHRGAGRFGGHGGREDLVRRLHRAGAGDEGEVAAADLAAAHVDDRVGRPELAAHQLVRLEDGDHPIDAGERLDGQGGQLLAVADGADDGDPLALRHVRLGADLLDAVDDVVDLLCSRALAHDDHHAHCSPLSDAGRGGRLERRQPLEEEVDLLAACRR